MWGVEFRGIDPDVSAVADVVERVNSSSQGRGSESPKIQPYLHGVQGLRTVAALMVAVYHIWFQRVSGGVDVFFVVAGYFAAGSMLKVVSLPSQRDRLRAVGQYWMRTLRRVVPSAVVVVVGTVLAGLLFLPRSQWQAAIQHGWASLTFRENWNLIQAGHDYLQQDLDVSAFQQFWALGIQVQAYFLFPVFALLAGVVARFVRGTLRRVLFLAVVSAAMLSFAFSVWFTVVDQTSAYFHLGARFWEFLAGVVLALALTNKVANQHLMRLVGWLGLATILGFAAILDPSPHLPGWLAVVPVVAAGAVILAARQGAEPSILRSRPMLWFADASFAFYLWHWPVLVFYRWQFGEGVSVKVGVAIIVLSAVLAVATTELVEKPVRESVLLRRSAVATIISAALLLSLGAVGLKLWALEDERRQEAEWHAVADVLAGAAVPEGEVVPAPAIARLDRSVAYDKNCQVGTSEKRVTTCDWGAVESETRMVLVGASKDTQWIDAVARTADELGVHLQTITKGACPFGDMALADFNVDPTCLAWSVEVMDGILSNPPDLVITTATRPVAKVDSVPEWKRRYLERLSAAGVPVLGVREGPRFGFNVPNCIDSKGVEGCSVERWRVYRSLEDLDVPELDGFTFLDMADEFCDETMCSPERDGVLVAWDGSHMTRTWTLVHGHALHEAIVAKLSEG